VEGHNLTIVVPGLLVGINVWEKKKKGYLGGITPGEKMYEGKKYPFTFRKLRWLLGGEKVLRLGYHRNQN